MTRAPQAVGILGGMGPAAGADFVRLFVQACTRQLLARGEPVRDQGFPEHWLAQVPVPDRTSALSFDPSRTAADPLDAMLIALGRLSALGSRAVAIACNTAHAWHDAMQARFPQVDLLHIGREVSAHLQRQGAPGVALMATEGTYRTNLYERSLAEVGLVCHVPDAAQRLAMMQGIFEGVKAGDMAFARRRFSEVALELSQRHGNVAIVMGCTEIPLALRDCAEVSHLNLVDPSELLAAALAARAYGEPTTA